MRKMRDMKKPGPEPPENGKSRLATGSSLLRENSSNGGKTIRTFWLHSRGRGWECQGEIMA
jgi:hypothetical protein